MALKKKKKKGEYHTTSKDVTERQLTCDLSEDLLDAWKKLRGFAASLGEQRIYASHRCIMFSRDVCYFFVRPKKTFLELCIFLPEAVESKLIARATPVSKTKVSNTFKLLHADQIEEPLTDLIYQAYHFLDKK